MGSRPGPAAPPPPRTAPTTTATVRSTRGCPAPARPRCATAGTTTATTWSTTSPAGTCGLAVGICRPGIARCVPTAWAGPAWSARGPPAPRPRTATALDDNCNGIVDDVASRVCFPIGFLGCTYNAGTRSYDCRGQCQPGLQACVMGSWDQSACLGAITPVPEVPCDQRDNNCDGLTDENDPTPQRPVLPGGRGRLHAGRATPGPAWASAGPACWSATPPPAAVSCTNAVTPDARGLRRQGQRLQRHDRRGVRRRRGLRQRGARAPAARWARRSATRSAPATVCNVGVATPGDEVCDGDDNDCDGQVDEAPLPGVGAALRQPGGRVPPGHHHVPATGSWSAPRSGPPTRSAMASTTTATAASTRICPAAGEVCPPPGAAGRVRSWASVAPASGSAWAPGAGSARAAWARSPRSATARTTTATASSTTAPSVRRAPTCMTGECLPRLQAPRRRSAARPTACAATAIASARPAPDKPCAAGQICNADGRLRRALRGRDLPDRAPPARPASATTATPAATARRGRSAACTSASPTPVTR